MNDVIETIQLTATSRLVVMQDSDAECPRGDVHMLTGFVKIAHMGDSRLDDVPAVYEPPVPIAEAWTKYRYGRPTPPFTDLMYKRERGAAATVERWARVFHGLIVEWDDEHGGFWFVAGADAETSSTPVDVESRALFYDNFPELQRCTVDHFETQRRVIAGDREVYRQWAEGEVYGVALERRTRYARVVSTGETYPPEAVDWDDIREEWVEVDDAVIWGCYLDEEYTAQAVAIEMFPLTDDELTGARGMFPVGDLDDEEQ